MQTTITETPAALDAYYGAIEAALEAPAYRAGTTHDRTWNTLTRVVGIEVLRDPMGEDGWEVRGANGSLIGYITVEVDLNGDAEVQADWHPTYVGHTPDGDRCTAPQINLAAALGALVREAVA